MKRVIIQQVYVLLAVLFVAAVIGVKVGAQYTPPGGTGGAAVWGMITGTLSSQTDLQSALNLKAASNATLTVGGVQCTLGQSCTPQQQREISFFINGSGSAIATGDLGIFPTVAFACTINRIDVSADQSGSITVDIWKRAGAIPTSGNKISASAPATLSAAQISQNGSLTGWSTAVSSGDVFGGTVASASTVQKVLVQVWCQ